MFWNRMCCVSRPLSLASWSVPLVKRVSARLHGILFLLGKIKRMKAGEQHAAAKHRLRLMDSWCHQIMIEVNAVLAPAPLYTADCRSEQRHVCPPGDE